jgi:very-short-patch-repair endonuclease
MPHQDVPPHQRGFAKTMRKAMTEPEVKLWNALRAHRLMGLSFRRQMPVGQYIVDFACPLHHVIVELDGTQHADEHNMHRDNVRTDYLQSRGWTVLRFWNDDVVRDIEGVCQHIVRVALNGSERHES